MEDAVEQKEGCEIEDRTNRSKDQHKVSYKGNISMFRLLEICFIDVIARKGNLGTIIEKIV